MNDFINYYELLGIDKKATKEEISKAYRMQAKKWHPDVSKEENASTIMNKLNDAKTILLDDDKKKEYDSLLERITNPNYTKFNKDSSVKASREYQRKTYTKWEYFREYLKYYNVSLFRKILSCILVGAESLFCGLLQLLNYALAYIMYTLGDIVALGAIIMLIIVISLFIINSSISILSLIIYSVLAILLALLPNILFKVLVNDIPDLLSKLNIFLFKKSIGYKEL